MPRKKLNLSIDDQQAVDLLLDHGADDSPNRVHKLSPLVPKERLTAARNLLSLLDTLSVIEPPTDLLAETLKRIDVRSHRHIQRPIPFRNHSQLH